MPLLTQQMCQQSSCVSPLNTSPTGGHIRAGSNNRLLLILYARNSVFDNQVRRQLALRRPILGIESASGTILPGTYLDDDDAGVSRFLLPLLLFLFQHR